MTPERLEQAAEAVHDAYLTTCARLGWAVKPENMVPYAELSEASKELDRASVRAVLGLIAPAIAAIFPAAEFGNMEQSPPRYWDAEIRAARAWIEESR